MFVFWDKESNLLLPDGKERTPEEIMNNPNWGFTKTLPTVLEKSGDVTLAIENLYILKSVYEIDDSLSDEAALAAIEQAIYNARHPEFLSPSQEARLTALEDALLVLI